MTTDRSTSFVPIQQKLNQPKVLLPVSGRKSTSSCIWDDMQGWMEQRQREWDDEMTQLKSEFFSIKPDRLMTTSSTSRRSSDASSLPEKMSIASSRFYDTDKGCRMFCVTFDVSQFEPEEVNIRTQGNSLIVHARHEERRENKSVSREFNRRVDIPSHINPDSLRCFIREDGTLQVEAELPSPSYDSSSMNRDSPLALENSSNFSDRLSDRDICSPPRMMGDRDMCSTPGTDRDVHLCSPPATYRDVYSPPKLYSDAYNPPRNVRDVLSPPSRDTDHYSGALESHWTNHAPQRNEKNGFNYKDTGDNNSYTPLAFDNPPNNSYTPRAFDSTPNNSYTPPAFDNPPNNSYTPRAFDNPPNNSYTPRAFDNPPQTVRDIYGATRTDNDIYNSTERTARDISGTTAIGPASDNRTTLHHGSTPDGNRHNNHPDVMARNGEARPIATENGHVDGGDVFSVVVGIGTEFEPHELAVQTIDRKLVVHARRTNPHFGYGGDIYREFDLPDGVDPGLITANLTAEGDLFIDAPTNTWPYPVDEHKNLPYPHPF